MAASSYALMRAVQSSVFWLYINKKYTYLNHNSTVNHFITQTQNPKFKAAVYLAKYKKTQLIKIDITLGYENLRWFKMLIFNF